MNSWDWVFTIVGVIGLIITVILEIQGKLTLSQRAQALRPRWQDWIIGLAGVAVFCYLQERYLYLNVWVFGYWCTFWGHIWIANKERYKK